MIEADEGTGSTLIWIVAVDEHPFVPVTVTWYVNKPVPGGITFRFAEDPTTPPKGMSCVHDTVPATVVLRSSCSP
jgi:hypothetical protein